MRPLTRIVNSLMMLSVCWGSAAQAFKPASFSARRDYPASGWVFVGDVNGDRIPDIVTNFGDTIQVLFGNGNGTFRVGPSTSFTWVGATVGALADIDGDGKPDIIIAGGIYGVVSPAGVGVCLGNGDGTFGAPVLYQTGQDVPAWAVVGDFNGDGIPDIIATSGIPDYSFWIFTGAGAGVLNPGVRTQLADLTGSPSVADFNEDGKLDLLLQTHSGFAVFFGNGDGTFQSPVNYAASGAYTALGDVNRDGHTDIAIGGGSSNSPIYMFLNNGHGVFSLAGQVTLSGGRFAIGDINGDGIADVADSAGCVALGEGNVKYAGGTCYPIPDSEGAYNIVLADFHKNGWLDVLVGHPDVSSVLLNQGGGQLQDGLWVPVTGVGNCGAAADYNGDGKPDLAVPTALGTTILLGTGQAGAPYATGATIEDVGGVGCPVAGDLNGDGIPDLVFGSDSAGALVSYLGSGDGTFRPGGTVSFGPGEFVLGDFNNDGRLDLAGVSNQLAWGKGDGTFKPPEILVSNPPFGGFSWIAKGDVDNDGWLDLLLTAYSTNQVYVLLNNHHGGFTVQTFSVNFKGGAGPISVMMADLNRDGKLDAVVQMFFGYSVAVYRGNGKGGFVPTAIVKYVGSYPQPPQLGDVNGDGIPDLLMPANGTLGIAYGKGDGSFLSQQYVGIGNGAGQIILTNIHGQPAASRVPDIVAPDSAGGVMVLINTTPK